MHVLCQILLSGCPGTGQPGIQLAKWLTGAGVQLPTPMARDLKLLTEAAAENKRLKQQQEVVRQAELELAARETEEHAEQYALLVSLRRYSILVPYEEH